MELITPLLKNDFREFCVSHLVLRLIHDIFTMAGVKQGTLTGDRFISGQRRTLVEQYYASLNWQNESDANKFLKVIGYALAQSYVSEEARSMLRKSCEREGLIVDGIQIYRKEGKSPLIQSVHVNPSTLRKLREKLVSLSNMEPHQRGFAFETFLKDLFEAYELAPRGSIRLVGEQIDGSFQIASDTYLLEAKWQKEQISQNDLLVFREKVENKSTWSRGLFMSYSGFTADGISAFARGRATNIIGMTGQDLYFILDGDISLLEAIMQKARIAAETGKFFVSIFDLLRE